MKKRILALLLALAMTFVLCACGGGGASDNGGVSDNGGSAKVDTDEVVALSKDHVKALLSGDAQGAYDAANWDAWYGLQLENGSIDREDLTYYKEYELWSYESTIEDIGEEYGDSWNYSFEITDCKEMSQDDLDDWNDNIYKKCGCEATAYCIVSFTYTIEGADGTSNTWDAGLRWFYIDGEWMMPYD